MRWPSNRFEIEESVADLLEDWGCRSYPFMMMDLACWADAELVPYSQLSTQERIDAFAASKDAFTVVKNGKHAIFYNEYVTPGNRRRFSMAHEIGHIWLGHTEQTEENEKAANYFAGYLLAPHPLIIKYSLWNSMKTSLLITDWCANYAYDQARNRQLDQRAWTEHEQRIVDMITVIGGFPCQAVA